MNNNISQLARKISYIFLGALVLLQQILPAIVAAAPTATIQTNGEVFFYGEKINIITSFDSGTGLNPFTDPNSVVNTVDGSGGVLETLQPIDNLGNYQLTPEKNKYLPGQLYQIKLMDKNNPPNELATAITFTMFDQNLAQLQITSSTTLPVGSQVNFSTAYDMTGGGNYVKSNDGAFVAKVYGPKQQDNNFPAVPVDIAINSLGGGDYSFNLEPIKFIEGNYKIGLLMSPKANQQVAEALFNVMATGTIPTTTPPTTTVNIVSTTLSALSPTNPLASTTIGFQITGNYSDNTQKIIDNTSIADVAVFLDTDPTGATKKQLTMESGDLKFINNQFSITAPNSAGTYYLFVSPVVSSTVMWDIQKDSKSFQVLNPNAVKVDFTTTTNYINGHLKFTTSYQNETAGAYTPQTLDSLNVVIMSNGVAVKQNIKAMDQSGNYDIVLNKMDNGNFFATGTYSVALETAQGSGNYLKDETGNTQFNFTLSELKIANVQVAINIIPPIYPSDTLNFTTAYKMQEATDYVTTTLDVVMVNIYDANGAVVMSSVTSTDQNGNYSVKLTTPPFTPIQYSIGVTDYQGQLLKDEAGNTLFPFTISKPQIVDAKFGNKPTLVYLGGTLPFTVNAFYGNSSTVANVPQAGDVGFQIFDVATGSVIPGADVNTIIQNPKNPSEFNLNVDQNVYQVDKKYRIELNINSNSTSTTSTNPRDMLEFSVINPITNAHVEIENKDNIVQGDNVNFTISYYQANATTSQPMTIDSLKPVLFVKQVDGTYMLINVTANPSGEPGKYSLTLNQADGTPVIFGSYAIGVADTAKGQWANQLLKDLDNTEYFAFEVKQKQEVPTTTPGGNTGGGGGGGGSGVLLFNTKPTALAANSIITEAGKETVFDGSGSTDKEGNIKFWIWNFGDNSEQVASVYPTAIHVYKNPGNYSATLTVKDAFGVESDAVVSVTVNPSSEVNITNVNDNNKGDVKNTTTDNKEVKGVKVTKPTNTSNQGYKPIVKKPIISVVEPVTTTPTTTNNQNSTDNSQNISTSTINSGGILDDNNDNSILGSELQTPLWLKIIFVISAIVTAIWTGLLANRYRKFGV